jgi:hypothetical protein
MWDRPGINGSLQMIKVIQNEILNVSHRLCPGSYTRSPNGPVDRAFGPMPKAQHEICIVIVKASNSIRL